MEYSSFTASDGCRLAYGSTARTNSSTCILLMHGFSGSSVYFTRNINALSARHWVVAPDMRGHGRSQTSKGGYHVARLAADLRELILHLRTTIVGVGVGPGAATATNFVPVGCSIGAAVLWTYIELFGDADFAGLVFVDQAPLQNRSTTTTRIDGSGSDVWDATKAHTGCYDEPTTRAAQHAWIHARDDAQRGLIEGCLGYYHPDYYYNDNNKPDKSSISKEQKREDFEFFNTISSQCGSGAWLAQLIGDHTAYDHREALELVTVPTLVMMGRYSGCFPLDGMRESVRRINRLRGGGGGAGSNNNNNEQQLQQQPPATLLAKESVFECGHWLFYEDAHRFNDEILAFVAGLQVR